jgi:DNA-directed RNA polymerase subunit L
MNPNVSSFRNEHNILKFTLSGVNYSFANAIRRNISAVPTVVFRTFPHDKNTASIRKNTSRFTNEIIKQRLSCIPIHITDLNTEHLKNMELVVKVDNQFESIRVITTEHFRIRDKNTSLFVSADTVRSIFPVDPISNEFIDFIRLYPSYSESMESEELELTCDFEIGNANEDGMFNVVSTCAYSNTPDTLQIDSVLLSPEHLAKDNLAQKNWEILESQRIYIEDSFDFIIETIGVFTNKDLLVKSLNILKNKVIIAVDHESEILKSQTTLEHGFELHLFNDDFTVGKMLENLIYLNYFKEEGSSVNFCAYKKSHPHDPDSSIIIGFNAETSNDEVVIIIQAVKDGVINIIQGIHDQIMAS